jgi:hypothetical protein
MQLNALAKAKPAAEAAEPVRAAPEVFGKLIVEDIAKWSRVAKQTGMKAE